MSINDWVFLLDIFKYFLSIDHYIVVELKYVVCVMVAYKAFLIAEKSIFAVAVPVYPVSRIK